MEQKAKRIGKFNIIDIIAVILIVAVLAFAGWKLLSRTGVADLGEENMVKVTYVVKCEGVPAELYETCQEHLPSPLMASGALVGGQIESVEKEPYYVLGPDGQWIEDPDHVTLLFTATTETPAGEVLTTKVGDQEVRIGKTDYILKSEYIEFSDGTIVDVQWDVPEAEEPAEYGNINKSGGMVGPPLFLCVTGNSCPGPCICPQAPGPGPFRPPRTRRPVATPAGCRRR